MKWKFLNVPLGLNDPFSASRKNGVLDAVFGFFGDLLDSGNVAATNESNRWQNLVTNQTNQEINESQLAWAREQYDREKAENRFLVDQAYERSLADRDNERAYNSAKAQAERLRAAGINPALAMSNGLLGHSGGSVSTVNSPGSPPHANQPGAIPMQNGAPAQPYVGFGSGIRDSLRLMYETDMAENDMAVARQRLNNETLKTLSDLKTSEVNNRYTRQLANKLVKDMMFDQESWNDRLDSIRKANSVAENQAELIKQQAMAQEFANQVAPDLNELQKKSLATSIAIGAAQVANIQANTALTEQQKKTEIQRTMQEVITRANLPKTLHNNNVIQVQTYKQIKNQAALLKEQAATERWHTIDAFKGQRDNRNSRSMRDYLDYATDALQYTDLNNARGFFRSR